MKVITSRDNPLFKSLAGLASSGRERRRGGRTLAEGIHLVEEYLACRGAPRALVVSDSGRGHPAIRRLLEAQPADEVTALGDGLFARLSQVSPEVGVLAVIDTVTPAAPGPIRLGLLLEGIQDPGNVGSILRSAAAAGAQRVWLSKDCA